MLSSNSNNVSTVTDLNNINNYNFREKNCKSTFEKYNSRRNSELKSNLILSQSDLDQNNSVLS